MATRKEIEDSLGGATAKTAARPRRRGSRTSAGGTRRFEAWRRRRTKRVIPPELWQEATELARRHGVSATSSALRLDYYALRQRVGTSSAVATRAPTAPTFIDIGPSSSASECVIEIEDVRGRKVKLEIKGLLARDLVALVPLFVGRP